jgi:hypothetical protein
MKKEGEKDNSWRERRAISQHNIISTEEMGGVVNCRWKHLAGNLRMP